MYSAGTDPASSWGHKLDGTEITWWDGVKRKWDPQPDNRKAFFRTGSTIVQNVAVSGGGDYGSFRLGLTHTDNKAIIQNSGYAQNTLNFGSNLNLSKAIKAEVTATYTNYNRDNTPDISNDQGWSNFMIYSMPRDYKPSSLAITSIRMAVKKIISDLLLLDIIHIRTTTIKIFSGIYLSKTSI